MITALNVKIYKNFNLKNLERFYNFYVDNYDYLDMQEFLDYIAEFDKEEYIDYPKIYAIKEKKRIKEYEVVATFYKQNNEKNYIIFTDNTNDSYGKIKLYCVKYDLDNSNLFAGNLTSQDEWNDVYQLINSIFIFNP